MNRAVRTLRKKIDTIDERILRLLNARARIARDMRTAKESRGSNVYDPSREAEILRRLRGRSKGGFPSQGVDSVFREIISATRSLEGPMEVAFLGPEGSYHHLAALRRFGGSSRFVPVYTIEEIFRAVEQGRCPVGVVAVENSIEGGVAETMDLFVASSVLICGELNLPISHALLSREKEKEKVDRVYSKAEAIAQCRPWLRKCLAWAKTIEMESTTIAAQRVLKERRAAAIASPLAAKLYGLEVLAEGLEGRRINITRFSIIGRSIPRRSGKDKTSLVLTLKDKAGALYHALAPLARYGVNMTRIESRPFKDKAWEYLFFIDVDGHVSDPVLSRALKEVEKECLMLKVLGSYPRTDAS